MFKKVKGLITARPKIIMVIVILTDKKVAYCNPIDTFPAWRTLSQNSQPPDLENFFGMTGVQLDDQESL